MTIGGRMVMYKAAHDGESEFVAADQITRVGRDETGGTVIYVVGGEAIPAREAPQVIADRIDDCYATEIVLTPDPDADEDEQ